MGVGWAFSGRTRGNSLQLL